MIDFVAKYIFTAVGIWTISALVGFIVCLIATWSCIGDLRDLGAIQNGRRKLAWSNIADEVTRTTILFSWFVLGVLYLMENVEPRSNLAVWVIVGGNVLLTGNSIRRSRVRTYIRSLGRKMGDETVIEAQDRIVGDERRAMQLKDGE